MITRLKAAANAKACTAFSIGDPAAFRGVPSVNVTKLPKAMKSPAVMEDTIYPKVLFSMKFIFPFAALQTALNSSKYIHFPPLL